MSLKKTDLVKQLAKKLDGKRKAVGVPERFGQGSAVATAKDTSTSEPAKTRLVTVACRLPADLAGRLRERAVTQEGGVHAVVAQAVAQWLDTHG